MQLANEDRSDAVRRDRRLRDCRSRLTRQSGSTGLGVQCKSTRRGMRWVFIILTSRSFILGEPSQYCSGASSFELSICKPFSSNDTSRHPMLHWETLPRKMRRNMSWLLFISSLCLTMSRIDITRCEYWYLSRFNEGKYMEKEKSFCLFHS